MPEDMSPGEIGRRLIRLEEQSEARFAQVIQQIDSRFAAMTRQVEKLQFVSRDYYDAKHTALEDRVASAESRMDKQDDERSRLKVAVITAVLAAFIFPLVITVVTIVAAR